MLKMIAPSSKGKNGYIFDVMCPGGEVNGKVYNKESTVLILFNNTASKNYNEICKVGVVLNGCKVL